MNEEKSKFSVLRPVSFKGDRVERGTILEITLEEANDIGLEYLKLMNEDETSTEETPAVDGTVDTAPENTEVPADSTEETPVEETPVEETPSTEETTEEAPADAAATDEEAAPSTQE